MICLDGHLSAWSPRHDERDPAYLDGRVDGALRPYLDRVLATGSHPTSSCQGGWVFRTSDQVTFQTWVSNGFGRRVRDPHPRWIAHPGPEENWALETLVTGGGSWWRKRPHLFLATGPGHGRSGILYGATELHRHIPGPLVLETIALCDALDAVSACEAYVAADETSTLVLLEGDAPMDDVAARAWWEAITAAIEKQRKDIAPR